MGNRRHHPMCGIVAWNRFGVLRLRSIESIVAEGHGVYLRRHLQHVGCEDEYILASNYQAA